MSSELQSQYQTIECTNKRVNDFLSGGLYGGSINQFFGVSDSGLMLLAMDFAIETIRNSGNTFVIHSDPIQKFVEQIQHKYANDGSIYLYEADSHNEQLEGIDKLRSYGSDIDLFVLDSFTKFYQDETAKEYFDVESKRELSAAEMRVILKNELQTILVIARRYDFPVIIINQTGNGEQNDDMPLGGQGVRDWSHRLLRVKKPTVDIDGDSRRLLTLTKDQEKNDVSSEINLSDLQSMF